MTEIDISRVVNDLAAAASASAARATCPACDQPPPSEATSLLGHQCTTNPDGTYTSQWTWREEG